MRAYSELVTKSYLTWALTYRKFKGAYRELNESLQRACSELKASMGTYRYFQGHCRSFMRAYSEQVAKSQLTL